MVKKVKDNDKCPCGSGKNYVNCHFKKLSTMNLRMLQTKEVIDEIKSKSNKIDDFYENFISPIQKNIIYTINEVEEQKNRSSYMLYNFSFPNYEHVIVFLDTDISKVNDSIIAHEYMHILLRNDGFPFSIPVKSICDELSRMLTNLIQDPLIYHRLKNNFDVSTDFKMTVKDLINELNGNNTGIHGLEKTRCIFNFSRGILIQKILFGDKDETTLLDFIKKKYAHIDSDIEELAKLYESFGFYTKNKLNDLTDKIIDMFKISSGCNRMNM
ncbi:MAG: SEC-C domain-containing protein [Candidatus Thermoplasmatota archaeon]|nr:SEC-C domain-containing protein [Candidatus Thermoplasmatota archaeon]